MEKMQKIILLISIILFVIIIAISLVIVMLNNKKQEEKDPIFEFSGAGDPYDDSQLNNFDIEIKGLNDEIISNIQNIDNFNYEFKKFVYLNGLVDADIATCVSYTTENNVMKVNLQLNNPARKDVLAMIYLGEDRYEFVTP